MPNKFSFLPDELANYGSGFPNLLWIAKLHYLLIVLSFIFSRPSVSGPGWRRCDSTLSKDSENLVFWAKFWELFGLLAHLEAKKLSLVLFLASKLFQTPVLFTVKTPSIQQYARSLQIAQSNYRRRIRMNLGPKSP